MTIFAKFKQQNIITSQTQINTLVGGKGSPLLLLHGYPQNYYMWHKIAPRLAEDFTVVLTDLRGYGDSAKPPGKPDHSNYAKRSLARDQIEVMSQLGYDRFYLVGHDRGARVAHRLTLDYPEKVEKLALLDIVPTLELYETSDREFATAYYHWFFLIQPYPFPETLIAANPEYFLNHCLQSWSKIPDAFTPDAIAQYLRCFSNPATIHATCEDYRAAATIDLIHDRTDLGHKITCPVLVLWGDKGIIGQKYDVLDIWRQRGTNIQGRAIACGHFIPEEAPDLTYQTLKEFLLDESME
ncbi:MAG: alpha/beta hydrolase [Pleurocapsa sp.]